MERSLSGCPELRRAKPALGTLVEVAVAAPSRLQALEASEAAFAQVLAVHRLMSLHEPSSDLCRLNRARVGEGVELDPATAEVLRSALDFARDSDGAFDCSLGGEIACDGLLPSALPPPARVPGREPPLVLEGRRATKRVPCLFDLGGIAKGFAVDRALSALLRSGASQGLVNAGGDLRHAGESPVRVHLRDPRYPSRFAGSVEVRNAALASSATLGLPLWGGHPPRVSALWDGRRRTPLGPGAGATIAAPTCLAADALTKVVLATRDARHPLLARHHARTVFHRFEE